MTPKTELSPRKSADPTALPAHLIPDERDRYIRWWRRFRLLENGTWIGWAGVALGYWAFPSLTLTDPRWKLLFVVIFGCSFLLGLGAALWVFVLYCPRCGAMLGNRGYVFLGMLNLLVFFTFLGFRLCTKCGMKRRELSDLASCG